MRKMLPLLLMAALLAQGCSLIPKYTRPEAPIPAAWPSGPAYKDAPSPHDTPLAAALRWPEFVADPHMQEIIGTALKNNRDLRIAVLNVERARALYRIQRAELLPKVNAGAGGIQQLVPTDISGADRSTAVEQFGADLGISSWEIDFFGRIRSLEKRALEEYFSTEQARRSAQILLVSEISNAYLALAADCENLKLAKSTLESQLAAHQLIKRRYEVGLTTELDLRQSQTRVESARVDVAKYTDFASRDENALNLLVGSPVGADLLPGSISDVKPFREISPGISSEVLLYRPDILQAEHLLRAANADIGAARAALFPRITLTTAVGTASTDLSNLFTPGSLAWNYAPQLVMPVFDPRLWAALSATKVQREIIVAQYEKAIQSAFREVADALAKKGTLGDQMAAQEALVTATAEAYRLSTTRYEKGTDIYLNVLDAQRSLYSAQQGLIAIRLANLSNQVRLYSALGGGGD